MCFFKKVVISLAISIQTEYQQECELLICLVTTRTKQSSTLSQREAVYGIMRSNSNPLSSIFHGKLPYYMYLHC